MRTAAIYARVSSEQQREAHTIASQTAALMEWAKTLDPTCRRRGSLKTRAIAGPRSNGQGWSACAIWPPKDRSRRARLQPDRLSRKYAYQILLIEELARHGVETRFLNAPQLDG